MQPVVRWWERPNCPATWSFRYFLLSDLEVNVKPGNWLFLWFRRRLHWGSEGEVWRGGGAAPAPLSCSLAALRPSSGTGSKQASPTVSSLQFYIFSLCCIAGTTVFYSNLKAAFPICRFCYVSGFADTYHWITDSDLVQWLSRCKKASFFYNFLLLTYRRHIKLIL